MECLHKTVDVHVTMVVINWTVGAQGNTWTIKRLGTRVSTAIKISPPKLPPKYLKHRLGNSLNSVLQKNCVHANSFFSPFT